MIITELQAETTYSVTVAAYTTKGDGARSKPKLITTTGAGKVTITASTSTLDLMIELLLYNVVKLQLRRERAPSKYSCCVEKCSVNAGNCCLIKWNNSYPLVWHGSIEGAFQINGNCCEWKKDKQKGRWSSALSLPWVQLYTETER